MYLLTQLVLLVIAANEVYSQSCTAAPVAGGPSGGFGSPLFRLYETFFTCTATITSLDLTLTGNSGAVTHTFSHWRTNAGRFELLAQQTVSTPGGITLQLVPLSPTWNVQPGDHLGTATTNNNQLDANVVAGQDAIDKQVPLLDLQIADATWPAVVGTLTSGRFLGPTQVTPGRPTQSPLITPVTSDVTTTTTLAPGVTTASTTTTTSSTKLCPILVTIGGRTRYVRGAPRSLHSTATALCPRGAVESRSFRCLARRDGTYLWFGGFHSPTVSSGVAAYTCRRYFG